MALLHGSSGYTVINSLGQTSAYCVRIIQPFSSALWLREEIA